MATQTKLPRAVIISPNCVEAHGQQVSFTVIHSSIGYQAWTDERLPIVTCALAPSRHRTLRELCLAAHDDIGEMIKMGAFEERHSAP